MAFEPGLNLIDGPNTTLDWTVVDNPGVAVDVTPNVTITSAGALIGTSATFATTSGVSALLPFIAVLYDTDSMVNLGTFPSRITVQTDGLYFAWIATECDPHSDSKARFVGADLNGVAYPPADDTRSGMLDNSFSIQMHTLWVRECVAGDYFEARVLQNSGIGLNFGRSQFGMQRIRP